MRLTGSTMIAWGTVLASLSFHGAPADRASSSLALAETGTQGSNVDASRHTVRSQHSTTPRTLEAHFADVFNVKDYGAVGDGHHDDSVAVQAAIAATPTGSPGGGVVFFPNGSYLIGTSGISVPGGKRGVRLQGASRVGTYLIYRGREYAVTVGADSVDTDDFTISDMTIDLASAGAGSGGVRCVRCTGGDWQRIWIQGRTTPPDNARGIVIDGQGNYAGNISLSQITVNGNFSVGVSLVGPHRNTCNHFSFQMMSISRNLGSARPGTGTIGFQWGSGAGDGAVIAPDVENYDVGYQIDGNYLFGFVRSEANGIGLRWGSDSYRNWIGLQSFSDKQLSRAGGLANNTLIDPVAYTMSQQADGEGVSVFRNQLDGKSVIALQAGSSAEHDAALRFLARTGETQWELVRTPANNLIVMDVLHRTPRILVSAGAEGTTELRSTGPGSILLNVGEGAGRGGIRFGDGSGHVTASIDSSGRLALGSLPFTALGAPPNGTLVYCSDCSATVPCAPKGTGALAKRINSTWNCQ